MNSTVYLFGDFGQGLMSYPIDYTQSLFNKFISESKAPTQVVIYRDGEIMNYGYIRKMENNHLFGMCIQINGQYLTTIKRLFDLFEDAIANMAVRGELIRINEQGNLIETTSSLNNNPKEIERITDYCRSELDKMESACKKLPPIDYSTSATDRNYFKEDDNAMKIITASVKNGCTLIYKKDDYDTLALSSYRSTLSKLNNKYIQATDDIKNLNKELVTLKRQKKQMGVVTALILILFIGSIVSCNVMRSKNRHIEEQGVAIGQKDAENRNLKKKTESLNQEKEKLSDDNTFLGDRNSELTRMYNDKEERCNKLASENKNLKDKVAQHEETISSLKSINKQLEQRTNELKKEAELQLEAKNKLTKDYNNLLWQYKALQNKYYQTREGKKELKKK